MATYRASPCASYFAKLTAALSLLLAVSACTSKSNSPSGAESASQGGGSTIVNLAIWSNYVSPEQLAEFKKRTGIQVQISNYSSNEELLAKLQAGASGYDVAVPSDYMVFVMAKLGLLKPLDFAQLSNSKSLDPKFMKKSYDPENKFSVPYDWGTTGIAINRNLYKGEVKGWKSLFNNPELAGKFTMLDDGREVITAAMKAQGFSLNSKSPEELAKSKALLMQVRPKIKGFTSETMMPLVNGEVAVAHAFMIDALQARRQTGGKIDYVVPEEGGTLWIDNLVIPAGAPHLKEAHQFINFLLEPKSNAETVKHVMVAPANKDAYALLPKDFQSNTVLFPPASVLAKCEMYEDLGEMAAQWDRVWTEIKAQAE